MFKKRAIIFDLGNVVIGFDHRIAVKRILNHTHLNQEEIYRLFFDSPLTQDFEKGKISNLDFFKEVKAMLGLKIGYDEFLPIWNDIFFLMPDTEKFIRSIPKDIKLVMLSNINKLHYEYIRSKFSSTLKLFGKIIPSYSTGFIKPEREIYSLAIRETKESLENIVYIDDRQDLVDAAQSYGINSIRFECVKQLEIEFIELGILAKEKDVSIQVV